MLPFALAEGPLRARCMMDNLSPGCGRCNLTAVLVGTSLTRSRPGVGICRILRSPPAARSPRSSRAACCADEGLGYRIVRSQKFLQIDTIFAVLIVIGTLGLTSDLLLRTARNRLAPWSQE